MIIGTIVIDFEKARGGRAYSLEQLWEMQK
jgi:hypothetical protein